MKALLPALFSFALSALSPAQTCREVVRDASGRIVQTIERQNRAGGTVQATTRDASGRITHLLQAIGIPHLLMATRSGNAFMVAPATARGRSATILRPTGEAAPESDGPTWGLPQQAAVEQG